MNKRELLFSLTKKDFIIEWFSGSGGGGQHRNKHQNCCRIKHLESGTMATGTEQRSREQNKKIAFRRLINTPDFKKWFRIEIAKQTKNKQEIEEELNRVIEEQLQDKYLKFEYGNDINN